MSDLQLTLAGGMYDRVVPLLANWVKPAGIDLRYLPMRIEEVFWRALRHQEFDATEISLAYYISLRSRGDDSYIALPVFPSRFFRQGCIFVPRSSKRRSLADLAGATVGVPEYAMTACVWVRGILADEHGIEPSDIRWRYGGIERPGRLDRAEIPLLEEVDLQPIGEHACLSQLLADGALDAVVSPRIPSSVWNGHARHLVEDYRREELNYFERTGVFPMMHAIALKRSVYERSPWAARSLVDAFEESKEIAYRWLGEIDALPISLPWYVGEYEKTRAIFDEDPWSDGLEPNREALELLCRYLTEQGLARPMALEELFASPALNAAVI